MIKQFINFQYYSKYTLGLSSWSFSVHILSLHISAKAAAEEKEEKRKRSFRWQGELKVVDTFTNRFILYIKQRNSIDVWHSFFIFYSVPNAGTTKRSPQDDRKPEGVWRNHSWPRRWRGAVVFGWDQTISGNICDEFVLICVFFFLSFTGGFWWRNRWIFCLL